MLIATAAGLFCVADGIGGAANGEVASREVVGCLNALVLSGGEVGAPAVTQALTAANASILQHASALRSAAGMGSTAAALLLSEVGVADLLHVGDSRIYHLRGNTFRRLTRDHSVAAEVRARMGMADEDELPAIVEDRLTRAIGRQPELEVEASQLTMADGDLFLLCTDGLTKHFEDAEIGDLLRAADDLAQTVSALVEGACDRGGTDNITVVLTHVTRMRADGPDAS
jgi:protein phosphatase